MEHLELLDLVKIRVNRRLPGWSQDAREDVQQDIVVELLLFFADTERVAKIKRIGAYTQGLIDLCITDAIRERARDAAKLSFTDQIESSGDDLDDTDPADVATDNEIASGLRLTRKQRNLFALRRDLGSTSAVARALNIPVQRASERLSRLFRVIRSQRYGRAA